MKELTLEEVLAIAGGLPLTAALDELTYRETGEVPAERVDVPASIHAAAQGIS